MPHILLRQIPRYECLLEASRLYPQLDPKGCEAFLHLLHTGDEIVRHFAQFFQKHGLSQGRFAVLMLLNHRLTTFPSPSTPAELADQCACTRATMTGLIDTLEKDGYVRREPDAEDRRVMRVCLTELGKNMMNEILPQHFHTITSLMNALSEAEQRTLVSLLAKILQRLGPQSSTCDCGNSETSA